MSPDEISLENYDYTQLHNLADRVAARMKEVRDQAAQVAPELRAKFEVECQRQGLTLEELCNGAKPRKKRNSKQHDGS